MSAWAMHLKWPMHNLLIYKCMCRWKNLSYVTVKYTSVSQNRERLRQQLPKTLILPTRHRKIRVICWKYSVHLFVYITYANIFNINILESVNSMKNAFKDILCGTYFLVKKSKKFRYLDLLIFFFDCKKINILGFKLPYVVK